MTSFRFIQHRDKSIKCLTREHAHEMVKTYIRAWEGRDPDLISTIFTHDAIYHERVLSAPVARSRDEVRAYWQSKVVGSQAELDVALLSLYVDGDTDTAIAEWRAEFDDTLQGIRKRMLEIAVLQFRDGLISSLREYWASESLGVVNGRTPSQPSQRAT